jgi:hypothetical protein
MATLLENYDEIKNEFQVALADSKVSFREILSIVGVIIDAAAATMKKITDKNQLEQVIGEAEELYDELLNPVKIDIPGIPEFLEVFVIKFAKSWVRPGIEKVYSAIHDAEPEL